MTRQGCFVSCPLHSVLAVLSVLHCTCLTSRLVYRRLILISEVTICTPPKKNRGKRNNRCTRWQTQLKARMTKRNSTEV
uniref:Putative secreted protein n=1 Tax=Ixodes ricinus TaxID=34613 RepID=A0A6B0UCS8_IXORI